MEKRRESRRIRAALRRGVEVCTGVSSRLRYDMDAEGEIGLEMRGNGGGRKEYSCGHFQFGQLRLQGAEARPGFQKLVMRGLGSDLSQRQPFDRVLYTLRRQLLATASR